MNKKIAVLAGDGVGPEVMAESLRVLEAIASKFDHQFEYKQALVGGAAYDEHGEHLPAETIDLAKNSDAILFGSVGGPVSDQQTPKWQGCEAKSILGLRKLFQFNINYRPATVSESLADLCPLKPEIISEGVDLLIIRELVGDIYFGEHSYFEREGLRAARDVAEYDEGQIRSVVDNAFQAARLRENKLTSVDKANVLHTSKLWREIVEEIAPNYPDVEWEHQLVDNCAMQLVKNPAQFDVIVTANLFGDILSDVAAVLPGSLGLTPSASFNQEGFALYEPSGGAAWDIAGKNIANPVAQILSAAMMLRYSFNLEEEANLIEKSVDQVFKSGVVTGDLASKDKQQQVLGTKEFTDSLIKLIKS